MLSCHDLKQGEVMVCEECGLELQVVGECRECGEESCECEEPCSFTCCGKELVLRSR